jgi:hypothetical protein
VGAAGDQGKPILILLFADESGDLEADFAEEVVLAKGIVFVAI